MAGGMAASLEPVAAEHDLGPMVSSHRNERPYVRSRARQWLVVAGPPLAVAIGVVWGLFFPEYHIFPYGMFAIGTVWVAALVSIGPIAARTAAPRDGFAQIVVYERGLIQIRESEHDHLESYVRKAARVVRFADVVSLTHRRERAAPVPWKFGPQGALLHSGAYQVTAEQGGHRQTLLLEGYRDEEVLIAAIEAGAVPSLVERARRMLDEHGRVSFGPLLVTHEGLLRDDGGAEPGMLPWDQVAEAVDGGQGGVLIHRRAEPGEPGTGRTGRVEWFAEMLPDGPVALALIQELRQDMAG